MKDDVKLLDRIDNWARWNRTNGVPQGRCASVEGRYVAPRPDDDKGEREAREPIDIRDAELVELAVQRIPYPLEREFLGLWYVRRARLRTICQKMQMRTHVLDVFRERCLLDLGHSIRTVELIDGRRARSSGRYNLWEKIELPSTDEIAALAAA